jgi:hypothetical protein
MTTKYFNVKQGLQTGIITLDATSGNANVANLSATAGITTGNITLDASSGNANVSNLSATTGIKTGDITLDASTGNANVGNIYAVNSVRTANLSVTGLVMSNLVPNGNGVLSLANATSRYKDFYLSGNIDINGQVISANSDGITAGNLFLDNLTADTANIDTITVNTQLIINSSTQSTSTNTGSFITEGGVGIKKDLTVGGNINLASSSNASPLGIINYNTTSRSIDFKFNG